MSSGFLQASGTVALGVLHQEGGFTFGPDYYFDPEQRWTQDVAIARWCRERFVPYPIWNAEAHLVQLDQLPGPFRQVGGLQPNLILAAALGAKLCIPGDKDPDVEGAPLSHVSRPADLNDFRGVEWSTREPIRTFLAQMDEYHERYEGRGVDLIPPFFWDLSGRATIHGPITTAHKLMGENFFVLLGEDRALATLVLDWVADAYLELIRLFTTRARFPARGLHVGECSGCMVGPADWKAALPAVRRLAAACGQVRYHSCGKSNHLLGAFAELPRLAALNLGSGTSLARVRERFGCDLRVDITPDAQLLCFGTPDAVRQWVDTLVAENQGGPLEIQFHLDARVPFANVKAIFETARQHGADVRQDDLAVRWTNAAQ